MKPFTWSYSKYKNYDTCPKRFYEVDIAKNFTESSEQLIWGNQVHAALANALTKNARLPDGMESFRHWIDEMIGGPGELVVEEKLAITKDFQPTTWFGYDVWFRGVCDVARINGPVALARDWKTGKLQHDSRQLMLMAQCLFVHNPELQRIKTEFVWLKEDCVTVETFNRDTIHKEWIAVFPQVKVMERAAETMTYEPKPGKLCARYCPVVSCAYHGKRR
jgi:hypothetical protein